jgi:hypothetical protein
MNSKNVLMLVILSAGMLTGLAATMIQAAPVFADTKDCEKNDNHNCNTSEKDLKIKQEIKCSVDDTSGRGGDTGDNSGNGGAGSGGGNSNDFTCTNRIDQPNTGSDSFNDLVPP